MLETIRIRKLGYHIRFSYQDFHSHFNLLLPREMKYDQLKENLVNILTKLGLQEDQFRLGKTKVCFDKSFVYVILGMQAMLREAFTLLNVQHFEYFQG